ncbi:MAG: TonB family protein [Bradymonadia bacterium]
MRTPPFRGGLTLWWLTFALTCPAIAFAQTEDDDDEIILIEEDEDDGEEIILDEGEGEAVESTPVESTPATPEGADQQTESPEAGQPPEGVPVEAQPVESQPAEGEEQDGPKLVAPKLLKFVEAVYPPAALEARQSAEVIMLITIDEQGAVTEVSVTKSGGAEFDTAALEAAKQFVFSPATADGEPFGVQIEYQYVFEPQVEEVEVPSNVDVGVLKGRLRKKGTGEGLGGLRVIIEGTDLDAFTDEKGRFAFESVPAGTVQILVQEPNFAPIKDEETVNAGEEVTVEYFMEQVDFTGEMVIIGRRPKKVVARRTLTIREIRNLPGTSGDALRIIQNLPGASRIPFGAGDLVLRGGGLTQPYLNELPIPQAFHFGGLRATVNSDLIEDIDIYPGNYSPRYGRVNGGIVNINLRRPKTDGVHGAVQADVFDASALVEGPIGEDAEYGALAVAFRRSYIDGVLTFVLPDDAGVSFRTLPRYYDGQILYDLEKGRHTFKVLAYTSNDQLVAVIEEPPEENPQIQGNARFNVGFTGAQAEWQWRASDEVTNTMKLQFQYNEIFAGVSDVFRLDFKIYDYYLRDEVQWDLDDNLTLRVGTDNFIQYGDIFVKGDGGPPKEGDPPEGEDRSETITSQTSLTFYAPSVWTELDLQLGDFNILPGARVDYLTQVGQAAPQLRLTARWKLTADTSLKAGVGMFAEPPQPDETDEAFGNPDLKFQEGIHYSLGAEHKFTDLVNLDVTFYYKDFDRLVTRDDRPDVRFNNNGIGRSYGMEFLLRHELGERFFGWIAYTYQISERRDNPGEAWRPFDLDQTHNLILIGQYKLSPTWFVGTRWRYVTGNPTTPITGSVYDSVNDTFSPVSGVVNSDRLSDFHQLDIRIDKVWNYNTWRLNAYFELQNTYNRGNPEGISYNYDYTESQEITGLPIIPSFGLRGEW